MGRDPNHPYRDLVDHPVQQVDAFLLQFDLQDEWAGIIGGPTIDLETGDICIEYNLRILEGPYDGQYCAEFSYRFEMAEIEDLSPVKDVYRQQVKAIESAFPDATIECYTPSSWRSE